MYPASYTLNSRPYIPNPRAIRGQFTPGGHKEVTIYKGAPSFEDNGRTDRPRAGRGPRGEREGRPRQEGTAQRARREGTGKAREAQGRGRGMTQTASAGGRQPSPCCSCCPGRGRGCPWAGAGPYRFQPPDPGRV